MQGWPIPTWEIAVEGVHLPGKLPSLHRPSPVCPHVVSEPGAISTILPLREQPTVGQSALALCLSTLFLKHKKEERK